MQGFLTHRIESKLMTHTEQPISDKKGTCLDGIGTDIGKDSFELLSNKGCGDRMDAIDSNGVLRGDRCDDGSTKCLQRGKSLEISLDSRSSICINDGGMCSRDYMSVQYMTWPDMRSWLFLIPKRSN